MYPANEILNDFVEHVEKNNLIEWLELDSDQSFNKNAQEKLKKLAQEIKIKSSGFEVIPTHIISKPSFIDNIFSSLPVPISYLDKTQKYLYANTAFQVFFGKKEKDILNSNQSSLNSRKMKILSMYFKKLCKEKNKNLKLKFQ